jgi:flavin-dependent dehydrogenase
MTVARTFDAIVIGGGPGGSTAAALLVRKGRDVVLLEKEKFPRYHIGESLLPYGYFVFEKTGVLEKMKKSHFTKKYSVQFVSMDGNASTPFYFHTHLNHEAGQTWQVERSEFDTLLLDHAREQGAEVLEETTVKELIKENGAVVGVRAVSKNGETLEFHAPITIDASGRDAVAVTKNGWKVKDACLNKMAVWTYYKGALRDPGVDEGATTVAYVPDKGWFWYIPLFGNKVSVGIVAEPSYLYREGRDPQRMFEREIENNKWIRDHLAPGKPTGRFFHTADYSYRSRYCASDGLVLVGDAFAFLDPVFSSGVFIALKSGELAAETVDRALSERDYSAGQFSDYGETMCQGIEAMRNLVYAFYDHSFSFGKLIKKYPHFKADVTDCLIGNLFIDFDPLYEAVAEFAKLPQPLAHGRSLAAVT